MLAEITGPRIVSSVPAKKGRRLVGSGAAAKAAKDDDPPSLSQAGKHQPNPPTIARKSAVITVRDRKTVQRQREQQQMAKLMQDEPNRSAIVTTCKPRKAILDGLLPDTPEERNRRADAALAGCLIWLPLKTRSDVRQPRPVDAPIR